MKRAMGACWIAAALALTGCEEIVEYLLECTGPSECDVADGRCIGSVLEVCRGDELCHTYNFWETKEDCATTGRVCVQVNEDVAWCAAPRDVPTTVLAEAPLSCPDAR